MDGDRGLKGGVAAMVAAAAQLALAVPREAIVARVADEEHRVRARRRLELLDMAIVTGPRICAGHRHKGLWAML
jgi:acetylornithine deacetylase/succinyl-diaminopimelate desuccinylase-like protein